LYDWADSVLRRVGASSRDAGWVFYPDHLCYRPGLSLKSERGPKGDRYQVELNLVSEKNRAGPITGSIFIDTNDREFQRVVVPVRAQIVDR